MDATETLICCGVSHHGLSLADRERIQPPRERWGGVLRGLLASDHARSAVLVATCNRIEFYVEVARGCTGSGAVLDAMLDALGVAGQDRERVGDACYLLKGEEVVRHLLRVSSGLDSMCVGESEILGQVKEAYSFACRCGELGNALHRLFHCAFRVGKQVRNETAVGSGVRSMAGAAQSLLARAGGGLEGKTLLLIGVNAMTETIAARTRGRLRQVFVNRTHCRAKALAERFGGEWRRLEHLERTLAEVDLVVTSTGSAEPLLGAEDLERVLRARGSAAPLVVCDLAVPRDVEVPRGELPGLVLLDQEAVEAHLRGETADRHGALEEAEGIVADRAEAFCGKLRRAELSADERAFLSAVQEALARELDRSQKELGPHAAAALEPAARRLAEKLSALGLAHLRGQGRRALQGGPSRDAWDTRCGDSGSQRW